LLLSTIRLDFGLNDDVIDLVVLASLDEVEGVISTLHSCELDRLDVEISFGCLGLESGDLACYQRRQKGLQRVGNHPLGIFGLRLHLES
jgi:hypothetical protein